MDKLGWKSAILACSSALFMLHPSAPAAACQRTNPINLSDQTCVTAVQEALIWTGDYTAGTEGRAGPMTMEALRKFQSKAGSKSVASLSLREYEELLKQAGRRKSDSGYRVQMLPDVGFELGLPLALLKNPANPVKDKWGPTWKGNDGTLSISALLIADGRTLDELLAKLRQLPGRKIEYERRHDDWFVLSGSDGDTGFYMRMSGAQGQLRGFSVSYKQAQKTQFGPIVIAMAASMTAPAGASGQTAPATAQRPATPPAVIPPAAEFVKRGKEFFGQKAHENALREFNKALAVSPSDIDALALRGLTYSWMKETDAAIRDLDQVTLLQPENPFVRDWKAQILEGQNQPARALAAYSQCIEAVPRYADCYYRRSLLYRKTGDARSADIDWQVAELLDPSGKQKFAAQPAQRPRPPRDEAIKQAGALIEQGQVAEGIAALTAIIDEDPRNAADPLIMRSFAYVNQQQNDKAIADTSAAIALAPYAAAAYRIRGSALDSLKKYDAALADATRALTLDPRDAEACNLKAWVLFEMGRPAEGLPFIEKALTIAPANAFYLDTRAHILAELGRKPEAIVDYRTALVLAPDLKESREALDKLKARP